MDVFSLIADISTCSISWIFKSVSNHILTMLTCYGSVLFRHEMKSFYWSEMTLVRKLTNKMASFRFVTIRNIVFTVFLPSNYLSSLIICLPNSWFSLRNLYTVTPKEAGTFVNFRRFGLSTYNCLKFEIGSKHLTFSGISVQKRLGLFALFDTSEAFQNLRRSSWEC